jgi:hypothetical protein
MNKEKPFICECGKVYTINSGLYKHKKTCNDISYGNSISINEFKDHIQKQQVLIINLTQENNILTEKNTRLTTIIHNNHLQ